MFEEAGFVDLIVHVRLLSYSDHDVAFSLYDGVIICKFFSHNFLHIITVCLNLNLRIICKSMSTTNEHIPVR